MDINILLGDIIGLLKSDSRFKNIALVRAYPPAAKPTRLDRIYVALGIKAIDLHPAQIDCSEKAGEISVFADIFVPFKMDNCRAGEVFADICSVLSSYNVMSVSASRLAADERIQASVLKASLTFNGRFLFGGENDE